MMKNVIISLTLFVGMLCCIPLLRADDSDEITSSTKLSVTLSTLPEARLRLTHAVKVPFLQWDSSLTKNNNVNFEFNADITPVSTDIFTEIAWTPVAFFQLLAGGQIGSGWNIHILNRDVRGIGLNIRNDDGTTGVAGSGFDGLLWNVRTGASLQFDVAAIYPGDWNHVIFRTDHEFTYAGYSGASKGEPWFFEMGPGEDCNGWNYYGSYLIGYQMPLLLQTVALRAEMKQYLYDTPNRELWGDNLGRWFFSVIFNLRFNDWFSTRLVTQMRTIRNFTPETADNEFYRDRRLDTPSRQLVFYRVGAMATFKLRNPGEMK